ncbi:MAG: HIT domain-containing protein [Bacteroidota bacterium]|nr:HIT domain-containing protein [Bacteroidota bacterium]
MERLYSPWRSHYIASFSKKNSHKNDACVFCDAVEDHRDAHHLLVTRSTHCFVMMNLYPYNSGHLLVIPYRHLAEFGDLSSKEHADIMKTISGMISLLKKTIEPHGFNIGANVGRVAGAGIDRHIHFHIVPRWSGDTNFMPVLADVKLVSEEMSSLFRKLKKNLK